MLVHPIKVEPPTYTGSITAGDETAIVTYGVTGPGLAPKSDCLVPLALPAAMKRGEPLELAFPVDPQLLRQLDTVQDILHTWFPPYRKVPVRADARPPSSPAPGVASFFSGGVDSFYTLLKHEKATDALIFVHGFDVKLADVWRRKVASAAAAEVAAAHGKRLIEVETDLRQFTDAYGRWGPLYNGPALASVGLLLGYGRVYMASSHSYRDLIPWGSHPLLDPLWSTGATTFDNDGAEATRVQKCAVLAN
jgi:hypothetical protein